jgi:amidohydrolase family protein
MRTWLFAGTLLAAAAGQAADPLPIFDAHLHYSHDAWEVVPPKDVIALLKKGGVRRALVSSSNDDGTQKLYAEAPELIIPELRPYRSRGEIGTWFNDATIVAHLEDRLKRYKYVAIGEFHLYGANADLPVPRRMVELAREYRLFLHAHSDADAIERLFRQDPNARILWAHSGFDQPAKVREMLRKHKNLYADLAFRSDHGSGGKVDAEWRAAFMEFPDRFMVGTDTFAPERWHYVVEHANWSRRWLQDLPPAVAEKIAYRNGEAIFGKMIAP